MQREPYPPKRIYRLGETRYVAEYIATFYPNDISFQPIRLGTVPEPLVAEEFTPEELGLLRVNMRWADGAVITDGAVIIIEGKLKPFDYLRGLAQLDLYRDLVLTTEQLKPFLPRSKMFQLVTPIEDPYIVRKARAMGIDTPIWTPPWFGEYLNSWFPRSRRAPRYK